jgi:hypothetical protein
MLSKCANPGCGVPFRYLNEGTVYVAEWCQDGEVCVLAEAAPGSGRRWNRLEMFWLCGPCNRRVTLTVKGNEVVAMPRAELLALGERPLRELRISG